MGAGAVKATDPAKTTTSSTTTRNNNSPQRYPNKSQRVDDDMSCEACSVHFTLIKRKKPCSDCGRNHCSDCLTKENLGKTTRRRCIKCRMLTSGNFTRNDLMKLTIKDLRNFMTRRKIPMNNCTEKVDLVELLMRTSNNLHYQREQADTRRRLAVLEERKRQHEADFERAQDPSPSQGIPVSTPITHQVPTGVQRLSSTSSTTSTQSQNVQSGSATAPEASQDQNQSSHNSALVEDANIVITNISDNPATEEQQEQQREDNENVFNAEEDVEAEVTSDNSNHVPRRKLAHLNDIADIESIENLSIRQLKELLASNYVDYKGCCEKSELIERVRRLWNEKSQEKAQQQSTSESDLCKICMDAVIDCVLLNCGHMVACTQCGKQMSECPVCRQYVVRVVHVFKA